MQYKGRGGKVSPPINIKLRNAPAPAKSQARARSANPQVPRLVSGRAIAAIRGDQCHNRRGRPPGVAKKRKKQLGVEAANCGKM